MRFDYLKENAISLLIRFGPPYVLMTFVLNMVARPDNSIVAIISGLFLMMCGLVFCVLLIYGVVHSLRVKRKKMAFLLYSLVFVGLIIVILYVAMPNMAFFKLSEFGSSPDAEAMARIILRYINTLVLAGLLFYHIDSKYYQDQQIKEKEAGHKRDLAYIQQLYQKDLETKNMETAFLTAQINPHFLHNTLASMAESCDSDSPEMTLQLWNLSDLMRYKLNCTLVINRVMPEKTEVDALMAYIGIMKWRFPDADIRLETIGEEQQQVILPTILLALVENMFKHGRFRKGDYPIVIQRELGKGYIQYRLRNKIDPQSRRQEHTGVGLQNIKRRLELLFPDKYQLEHAADADDYFNVYLRINQVE